MVPGSRTLELATTSAGALLARRLQVSPAERLVRVKRLRLADAQPMAMEVLHIPETLVPGLTRADLEDRSFYDLLGERYGFWMASARQGMNPPATTAGECKWLGGPRTTPAFLSDRPTAPR